MTKNGLIARRGDNHENKFIYNQELFKRKEMLATALKDLDEREVHNYTRRLVDDPLTPDQLQKFGISREKSDKLKLKLLKS